MSDALLHVVFASFGSQADAKKALFDLRRLLPRAGQGQYDLLLFADLCSAPGKRMPQDAALLRTLQSGVMSIQAHRHGRVMLLCRSRLWDDASRMYLGADQKASVRSVMTDLLLTGQTFVSFDAATVSPESLCRAYDAVLFSSLSLICTPDTPERMLHALKSARCAAARILPRREDPPSALFFLLRSGFSLSPLIQISRERLRRHAQAPGDSTHLPVIFSVDALADTPDSIPLAENCVFFYRENPTMADLFRAYHAACLHRADRRIFLAPAQLLLLFLAALSGRGLFMLAALLPELFSLVSLRLLSCAAVRLAFLPITAGVSLNAWLMRLSARSRLLRPCIPKFFMHVHGGAFSGIALLLAAIRGTHMLAPLLPVSLLWLFLPLILPALSSPATKRLPLSSMQHAQLLSEANRAYAAASSPDTSCERRMLAACAGCMLGLIETDEAARRAEALLSEASREDPVQQKTAADLAAVLVSAQYLREEMSKCDAALRSLPQKLESYARSCRLLADRGALCAFLSAAVPNAENPDSDRLTEHPLDALFLPLRPASAMEKHAVTLPLTHPQTYLKRKAPSAPTDIDGFLSLAAAALSHPFYPLLLRSPVTGPYAALLLG